MRLTSVRFMPEVSSQSITVAASPAQVMAVISDFAAYPKWTGSIKRADVLETGPDGRASRVGFTLDAGVLTDEYELAYTWTSDEKVEWHLLRGQLMRSQDGSYEL